MDPSNRRPPNRKSQKLIRLSRKDQLIDREKKYLFNSMPVKRNVFKEVILLNQYLKYLDNEIKIMDNTVEDDIATVTFQFKETLDDENFFGKIHNLYDIYSITFIDKTYLGESIGFELKWYINTDCPFYYLINEEELPKYVKEADHINSHKNLNTEDLEIFHRIFGSRIIKKNGSDLKQIIKNSEYIKEIQDLKKNEAFFNHMEEERDDGYVRIKLNDTRGNLPPLLEKTELEYGYMDRTIYITLDERDAFYFALTGREIPHENLIARYISTKKEIEDEKIMLLPSNLTGLKSKKK